MLAQEKETTTQLKIDHSTGEAGSREAVPATGGTREPVPPHVYLPRNSLEIAGFKEAVPSQAVHSQAAGPAPVPLPDSFQPAALPRDKQLLGQLLELLAIQLQTPNSSSSPSPQAHTTTSPQAHTNSVSTHIPEADTSKRRTRDPRLRRH